MTLDAGTAFTRWYCKGKQGTFVRTQKSPGGILNLIEVARPGGDMNRPALPDLILYQDMQGGSRVSGDSGGGYFNVASEKGSCFLSAPDFANRIHITTYHQTRGLRFPKSNGKA